MTRRDYIFLAECFKASLTATANASERQSIAIAACDMAALLARENPRFEERTFLVNCGIIADSATRERHHNLVQGGI